MAGRSPRVAGAVAAALVAASALAITGESRPSVAGEGVASTAPTSAPSTAPASTATYTVRGCRTAARVWRGSEPPGNDARTGELTGTQGARLRTGDDLTVDVPPVPGGSYDSGCSGTSDFRWYRLHERNGETANGWVSAQAIASVPPAGATDPDFPRWGEPTRISQGRVDDVAIDRDGSVHTVNETEAGIVYATNRSGEWTSETIMASGSREPGSRARFEVTPRIAVDDGRVAVVFGDRRREPGPGDCAPGPCWEVLGSTVMVGTADGWMTETFEDLTAVPETADATADVAVHGADVYVTDGRQLAILEGDIWTEVSVPLSYRRTDQWGDTIAALAIDDARNVHVVAMDYLGREMGYARRDASGWQSSTIASGQGVLSSIVATDDGGALIGYSSARERYPGELCAGDCAVPSIFHLVTMSGSETVDTGVPGDGWGVLAVDASDAPMVARWGVPGIAWRRSLGGVWQTTSWAVPAWDGSFTSHQEVGGVQAHGLWVFGGDGSVGVVYEPRGGGTWLIMAAEAP